MLNLIFKQRTRSMRWPFLVFFMAMSGVFSVMAQSANTPFDLRDPFQPIVAKICQPTPLPTASWHLQGTVGSEKQRVGWIMTPEGHVQRFQLGDFLPSTPWQVAIVGTNYVELHLSSKAAICQNSDVTRFTLSLPKR